MAIFKGSWIDNVVAALAPRRLGHRAEAEKVIAGIRATPEHHPTIPAKLGVGDPHRPIRKGTRSPGLSRTLPDTGCRVIREWRGLQRDKRMHGKKFGVFSQ